MTYIHHVTLNTGDSRRSLHSEVNLDVLSFFKERTLECEQRGEVTFPSPTGDMLLRRILDNTENPSRHIGIWSISEPGGPALVTFALAMTARAGAGVWRMLHESHAEPIPLATRAYCPPPSPWLGVIIHSSAMLPGPHASIPWLGDAERCIAWSWIEVIYDAK